MLDIFDPNFIDSGDIDNIKFDKFKYAVFSEWSCDPPSSGSNYYMDAWGESYEDLIWPVEEIYSHFEDLLDEDNEDDETFFALYKFRKPTKDFLENYAFDNGGLGCECCFVAEGRDIAEAAIKFFNSHFELYEEDDDYEEKKRIIEEAESHPDDCKKVLSLIRLVSEAIEEYLKNHFY